MRTAVVAHYIEDSFINKLDKNIYNICYKSKRYNYVYLYFNANIKETVIRELKDIDLITDIEDSLFEVEEIII